MKVDSLGDQALFVDDSSSLSIYVIDDDLLVFHCTHNGGGFDMGVFSMENATIKPLYSGQFLSFLLFPTLVYLKCIK